MRVKVKAKAPKVHLLSRTDEPWGIDDSFFMVSFCGKNTLVSDYHNIDAHLSSSMGQDPQRADGAYIVGSYIWAGLPKQAQCKHCKYIASASLSSSRPRLTRSFQYLNKEVNTCATDEQIAAVECFLHLLAKLFTPKLTDSLGPSNDDYPNANVEMRAAELYAASHLGRLDRFRYFTPVEFDWYVHGHSPPHSAGDYTPETDEEWGGWLSYIMEKGWPD